MTSQNDLLRAPTRKRKPRSEHVYRRVRTMWDVDTESTTSLLEDMGVAMLDDDDSVPMPTPPSHIQRDVLPPGAPRVLLNMAFPSKQHITPMPTTQHEHQGPIDNSFLFKQAKPNACDLYDHWHRLSEEIILSIFKWLPKPVLVRCARVCKRWNRLAFDETLWRRLDLANKVIKTGVLGRILSRGVAVMRLTKAEVLTPLFTDLNDTLPRVSKVQYLDLSMATVSSEGLEELFSPCHLLRKLSLENCQLNTNVCRYIGQNSNLEVLNLCMCSGISENGLVPICNNLQRLDALNIGWTDMTRGAVLYLVICLPTELTKLNLSGCRMSLLDEDIQQLCNSCPHLKELDLSDATMLSSASVECIATSLNGLEYIALSRCYRIIPSSLTLLGNIPTLLALDVFGMLKESALLQLRHVLCNIEVNKFPFSSIARPTTGIRRTSIWGVRVRDTAI
ncbi:S-phase kinase-associated protein 2 [Lamellibrachia satsuma]|nr:S-phase kinase-associated protein 2 [Lamellibrachia satsuma]